MGMARRSSRANRANQDQVNTQFIALLNTATRADRSTRSSNKAESPEKSTGSKFISVEPQVELVNKLEETNVMQTRRKRGRAEEPKEKHPRIQTPPHENKNDSEDVGEDDDAVRCICGHDDYPGLPQPDEDGRGLTQAVSEGQSLSTAEATEDLAGFYLQCDICKVWQHGGCVGIMNEGSSPEEYFCEGCRKDLHKIFTSFNGQRYSHYLPLRKVLSQLGSNIVVNLKDETRPPRVGRSGRPSSLQSASAKRRSTMNSRDAAYDEGEQLRRVIEASKSERISESTDTGIKRSKRGFSGSEEKAEGSKRQRTSSTSPSRESLNQSRPESEDETLSRNHNTKKSRLAGAKISKECENKTEREKFRIDVGNKRSNRAERRRTDDAETMELASVDTRFSANKGFVPNNTAISSQPMDPAKNSQNILVESSHSTQAATCQKKIGRPPNSRKGKMNKSQYSKDRDLQDHYEQQSNRQQSRDVSKSEEMTHYSSSWGILGEGKVSRSKGNPNKITMADMKRRVTMILDFISRTQLEMASEPILSDTKNSVQNSEQPIFERISTKRSEGGDRQYSSNNETFHGSAKFNRDFKDLSCRDMMDVLTKQLIKWQKEFL
ncbi:BgTH12-02061 [Blumeria graminis f. sp. triticale]|uniref:BgTH12-02061 n=1 Tax=Blumeria graminis f. sp. triticale TaxID=1689686 RepID=A0A9W4GFG1_BLUGR|nr:BgTH12-02061 [Blumeria graminis f. sp. triticale]